MQTDSNTSSMDPRDPPVQSEFSVASAKRAQRIERVKAGLNPVSGRPLSFDPITNEQWKKVDVIEILHAICEMYTYDLVIVWTRNLAAMDGVTLADERRQP